MIVGIVDWIMLWRFWVQKPGLIFPLRFFVTSVIERCALSRSSRVSSLTAIALKHFFPSSYLTSPFIVATASCPYSLTPDFVPKSAKHAFVAIM